MSKRCSFWPKISTQRRLKMSITCPFSYVPWTLKCSGKAKEHRLFQRCYWWAATNQDCLTLHQVRHLKRQQVIVSLVPADRWSFSLWTWALESCHFSHWNFCNFFDVQLQSLWCQNILIARWECIGLKKENLNLAFNWIAIQWIK